MEFGVSGDCGEWTFQGAILEACIWCLMRSNITQFMFEVIGDL